MSGRRLACLAAVMADVAGWRSPVLLIHGDDDRNVPFSETVRLAEALREQGVDFEQLVFPDEVHSFLTHSHFLEVYRSARISSTGTCETARGMTGEGSAEFATLHQRTHQNGKYHKRKGQPPRRPRPPRVAGPLSTH